jgi:hypothetical protein
LPTLVVQAATLAAILEHLNDKQKPHPKKFTSTRSDSKGSFNALELWKARQLREYRRANNLCFKCGEKYSPSHSCATSSPTLNVMEKVAVDGGEFLPDELLDALDSPNIHLMQEEGFLSLHAMSGLPIQRSIQLKARVKNQALTILVDSGSSHTFLNSNIAHKLQLQASPITPMSVKVANGVVLSCQTEVKDLECWIQGHTFELQTKIIDMGAYDIVLGMDWLENFRPMVCDWLEKWMEFQYKGVVIRLQGIQYGPPSDLTEVSTN